MVTANLQNKSASRYQCDVGTCLLADVLIDTWHGEYYGGHCLV